jgi:hypothetical protein
MTFLLEQAPTNSMGASSSVHGTGSIDLVDRRLKKKPLRRKARIFIEAVRMSKGLSKPSLLGGSALAILNVLRDDRARRIERITIDADALSQLIEEVAEQQLEQLY